MTTILPKYNLKSFRKIHRQAHSDSPFGHKQPDPAKMIDGFELYSSEGVMPSASALKVEFYRMSITVTGSFDMQIGTDRYSPKSSLFVTENEYITGQVIAVEGGML